MNKVTPRDFRNAFVAVMKAEHRSFRAAVGFEPKSYSYFMRTHMLPRVAKQLGLLAWNKEYHGIESMFYEERGTDKSGNFTAFAKWVAVALEHERLASKTPDCIAKLQLFNVPLKVLISYAADGAETDSLLRKYEAVIGDSDIFKDTASSRQQLVIFGTPKSVREWRFYVYESDGFVLMLPG
jgi:hypothetical protein